MRRVGARLVARAGAALAMLVLGHFAVSCQSLAGIEERELGPCGEYCDVVMRTCSGQYAAYESREKCLGTCRLLEPGDPVEPQGTNTVECRLREARRAETAISEEVAEHCRGAGPEGIGCAESSCQSYCSFYEGVCGVQCNSLANCVDKCRALRDEDSFNAFEDYEGDTLQCRLVHISNATLDPVLHCQHAKLVTPTLCVDGPDDDHDEHEGEEPRPSEPRCEDYCRVVGVACTQALSVYESDEQCLATCGAFEPGSFDDTGSETIGCRLYHAYNALCLPDPHCSHAGPSGGGTCGSQPGDDECAAYCRLAESFCEADFADAYPDGRDACLGACAALAGSGDRTYSVALGEAGGDTLACRVLHGSRAATDPTACPALFGESPCRD